MSKKINVEVTCPNCTNQFGVSIFRSIWGEYPENRELVMSDSINVVRCPNCKISIKLPVSFIYTNANLNFAVWWEPSYDSQIDSDSIGYTQMMGVGNYLAAAPRIKDWKEFKETILKFETGELQGKKPVMSQEINKKMEGFLRHIDAQNKKKSSGCLGLALLLFGLVSCLIYNVILIMLLK